MAVYSHSKLSSFEQCPYKYKLRYIDKIIPEVEKSIELYLGTSVHNTLEWLYSKVQNQILPTIDETINYFIEVWQEEFTEDILINRNDMTARDYFEKGISFLLNYYTKNTPFEDGTLELEKEIAIEIEPGTIIRGFIDRLTKNPQTNEFEVHDYKTANTLPTQEKIDNDRQLALYALAIKELFGKDKEVCLVWHFLNFNTKIISHRTNEQLENLKKETIQLIRKIESTNNFSTCKSPLCGWCEYKNQCPEF